MCRQTFVLCLRDDRGCVQEGCFHCFSLPSGIYLANTHLNVMYFYVTLHSIHTSLVKRCPQTPSPFQAEGVWPARLVIHMHSYMVPCEFLMLLRHYVLLFPRLYSLCLLQGTPRVPYLKMTRFSSSRQTSSLSRQPTLVQPPPSSKLRQVSCAPPPSRCYTTRSVDIILKVVHL